jgi:SAM-dependent methyltransferase
VIRIEELLKPDPSSGSSGGWREVYLRRWYSARSDWVDGTTQFHEACSGALRGRKTPSLLEIGAGSQNPTTTFLSKLGSLTGVDVDPLVLENPAPREAVVVADEALPFQDCSFDACFSNWVLEHVENPESHLTEVARVLKPGGVYIARTPNRFHYVSLVAGLTPHWFHKLVANRLRRLSDQAHEPWRTFYRMNSRGAVHQAALRAGLIVTEVRLIESQPSYGLASRRLFILLALYERAVNATKRLEGLRHTMLVVLSKPNEVLRT